MNKVYRAQLVSDLRNLGIEEGQIVFLHSSLSAIGHVQGGAATVVDAFLEVLGIHGTLLTPTFTLNKGRMDVPIFDPRKDQSEMGAITEKVRTHFDAYRSCHLLHSVAGLGKHAARVTAVHGPSAWAADGPFWQMHELDAKIVLLGVPYLRCTWFHVIEQLVQVCYRSWVKKSAWVREVDGRLTPLPTLIYKGNTNFAGNDFNKFGLILEKSGLVKINAVGNAVSRCFRVRDILSLGIAQYRQNPLIFTKTTSTYESLQTGIVLGEPSRAKIVVDPSKSYQP